MTKTATMPKELVAFLREQVGEHLRSVLYYDDNDWDVLSVHNDVADAYDERERMTILRDMRIEAIGESYQEDLYIHGSLNYTIRCFEDAIVMYFIHGEKSGTAVALDGEVFAVQNTFVGRCLEVMGQK